MNIEIRPIVDEAQDENGDTFEQVQHSIMGAIDVGDVTNFAIIERLRINGQWFIRVIDNDREEAEWNRRR